MTSTEVADKEVFGDIIFLDPLKDHNYVLTKPKQKRATPKITKKNPSTKSTVNRITSIKAIYNCRICGFTTMNKGVIDKHSVSHKGHSAKTECIPCDKCNVRDTVPKGYSKCSQCSFFAKRQSSLKIHSKIHSNGTPYKCTECDFSGEDLKVLIQHYKNARGMSCNQCAYSTHVKQRLLAHFRSHDGERPFCCGVCGYGSSDRADLYRHLKVHSKKYQ